MTESDIAIRPTEDPDERLAILAIAHRANERREPLPYYQALRLALPRRKRAEWWLLISAGQPAASLMCYPLMFRLGAERIAGFGLGAVATSPDFARRGLASRLCSEVARRSAAAGRPLGLLFSAIRPVFYERLGYRVAPAWDAQCERLAQLRDSGPAAELRPLDPQRAVLELAAVYDAAHAGLHLDRDERAWHQSFIANARDLFFGLGSPLRGYARIYFGDSESLAITELVLEDRAETLPVARALAGIACELGRPRMGGWFPPHHDLAAWFQDAGRARTLPMVNGAVELAHSQFWESDYF